jgi:lipoate-protein ligase A
LIRVSIVFNCESKIIQSISIHGDFFAYPKRSIFDLEAALKFVHQDRVEKVILDFAKNSRFTIPDTTPHDFVKVIKDALSKTEITEHGLSFSEANQIFCVKGTFKENLKKKISSILLPYCAKSIDCELRYRNECDECGQCAIGEIYGVAKEHGMNPITIVNYEDLKSTLINMKSQGVTAYLGSCCAQFYVKHKQDFENAGMSGILVGLDSATCYDLGEEKEAYSGDFARQTGLDLELMKKIIEKAA